MRFICYKYRIGEFILSKMTDSIVENFAGNPENIVKVGNVEVVLYAELGKTKLSLKDILEYDTGSIITLDKMSNDLVNIYVDDILIAKGQIVAIEDTYGIKIAEIVENSKIKKR